MVLQDTSRENVSKISTVVVVVVTVMLMILLLQLVVTPPVISTSIFVTVIHMLVMMCIGCPDLAVVLLKLSKFFTVSKKYFPLCSLNV